MLLLREAFSIKEKDKTGWFGIRIMWSNWPNGFGEDTNVKSVQMTDAKWYKFLIRRSERQNIFFLLKKLLWLAPPVLSKCHPFLLCIVKRNSPKLYLHKIWKTKNIWGITTGILNFNVPKMFNFIDINHSIMLKSENKDACFI